MELDEDFDRLDRMRGYGVIPASLFIIGISLFFMTIPVIFILTPFLGGIGVSAFLFDLKRLKAEEKSKLLLSIILYIVGFFVFIFAIVFTTLVPLAVSNSFTEQQAFNQTRLGLMVSFGSSILFQASYMILPYGIATRMEKKLLASALVIYAVLAVIDMELVNNGTVYPQLLPGSTSNSFGFNIINFELARIVISPGLIVMAAAYLLISLRIYRKSQEEKMRII